MYIYVYIYIYLNIDLEYNIYHTNHIWKGYLRRTSKYLESIAVSDPIHMTSMVDLVAINVETPMIDTFSFDKIEKGYEVNSTF